LSEVNTNILSVYLKKWSFGEKRFTINYAFCTKDVYHRRHKEFRLAKPVQMLEEFLEQVSKETQMTLPDADKTRSKIHISHLAHLKPLLKEYFENIAKEFLDKKSKSGKTRMNLSRSMDLYYRDKEYSLLDDHVKFYVHLNRGLNKVNGELWGQALTDLLHSYKYNPKDITLNKYLALVYNKLGKYSRAILPLKVYAEADNTPESLNALAAAYINLEDYAKADALYKEISENFGEEFLATYGQAIIAYKQGGRYLNFLDTIKKKDPLWLSNKLKNEWDYSLINFKTHTEWNAATAARYLGFDRPFDLTRKAINHEIPCYYDSDKGTVRFIREELDCWVELHNRYNLDGKKYEVFLDRLLPDEKKRKKRLNAS